MNRNGSFAAAALTGGVLGLWGTPVAAQPRMPTHVACVGDSITAGNGSTSSTKTYPADLQSMFGTSVKVSNFGHSGATMLSAGDLPYVNQSEYTAATTFVSNAGANAVVDVILMLGTNDTKSYNWMASGGGTRMQQFITDCAAIVDHFANLSTHPVVYLALPPKVYANGFSITDSVLASGVIPALMQVAMQKGLPTIDVYTPTAHPEYFGDGVHPTDAGYVVLAGIMHDGLLRVPQVTLTTPSAGASVGGAAITLGATASGGTVPITSVQFFAGATSIATAMQSPFMATWSNAAAGPYMLTAKATDKTGASATSTPVSITVVGNGGAGGGAGGRGTGGGGGAGGTATGSGGASGGRGGAAGTGGTGTGGAATGGSATGGAATGGNATGGAATGGNATGGNATGGAATGGAGTGGAAGSGATGSDAGCGSCDVGAGRHPSIGTIALLLAALGMRRSRRRGD
jgi:lysophospholipase L1-like esterase